MWVGAIECSILFIALTKKKTIYQCHLNNWFLDKYVDILDNSKSHFWVFRHRTRDDRDMHGDDIYSLHGLVRIFMIMRISFFCLLRVFDKPPPLKKKGFHGIPFEMSSDFIKLTTCNYKQPICKRKKKSLYPSKTDTINCTSFCNNTHPFLVQRVLLIEKLSHI